MALRFSSKILRSSFVINRSTDEMNAHIDRQWSSISSITSGFMLRTFFTVKTFSVAILIVCLSVAFKLLNCVTSLCKSGEKFVMNLEALGAFDGEKFSQRELNELGVKEIYQFEITNWFAVWRS